MIHEAFPLGMFQCNCQILGNEETREAIIFDPGDEPDQIVRRLEKHGLEPVAILLTHAHIDHVGAIAPLVRRFGLPVHLHAGDRPLYEHIASQAQWAGVPTPERVTIGHWIEAGRPLEMAGFRFETFHTPGHSPGSISFYLESHRRVIAGDVLFRGSIGRTDLPGGDLDTLLEAIRTQLFTLPDDTVVYPGHGPTTTIGHEKLTNPFLST